MANPAIDKQKDAHMRHEFRMEVRRRILADHATFTTAAVNSIELVRVKFVQELILTKHNLPRNVRVEIIRDKFLEIARGVLNYQAEVFSRILETVTLKSKP